jgi:hypothetical protein
LVDVGFRRRTGVEPVAVRRFRVLHLSIVPRGPLLRARLAASGGDFGNQTQPPPSYVAIFVARPRNRRSPDDGSVPGERQDWPKDFRWNG